MTVILTLTVDPQDQVIATHDGAQLGEPAPLTSLARIGEKSNPYRFDLYGLGAQLFAALGGPALLALLDADAPDYALHLVVDEYTASVPWEYASQARGRFLACEYAMLRLLPGAPPAPSARPGPINFVALAADPLVDQKGRPRTGQRLQVDAELAAVAARLAESAIAINARRIPPTARHLQAALGVGPAVLHLTSPATAHWWRRPRASWPCYRLRTPTAGPTPCALTACCACPRAGCCN